MSKTKKTKKNLAILSTAENVEELEILYIACGNAKLLNLGKRVWQFLCTLIIWPAISRESKIQVHTKLCVKIYGSFIHNDPDKEIN